MPKKPQFTISLRAKSALYITKVAKSCKDTPEGFMEDLIEDWVDDGGDFKVLRVGLDEIFLKALVSLAQQVKMKPGKYAAEVLQDVLLKQIAEDQVRKDRKSSHGNN